MRILTAVLARGSEAQGLRGSVSIDVASACAKIKNRDKDSKLSVKHVA